MLDSFVYEDHLGRRFVGLDNGVYLNYGELRDYSWEYDTINNKISRFYRKTKKRKIPLVCCCSSDAEAVRVKHRLLELTETDIEAKIPGKIFVGDYYTNGYITESEKADYLINKRICNIDLTLTSDDPTWFAEKTYTFVPGTSATIGIGDGSDYQYDYPYDYAFSQNGKTIVCDSVWGGAFRLKIYGEATEPTILINGHAYTIHGVVSKGETLLIDTITKTITLTTATGGKINWFDKRNRESYIFEEIPAGQRPVVWDGSFGFDLTVIEKRSEPKWT